MLSFDPILASMERKKSTFTAAKKAAMGGLGTRIEATLPFPPIILCPRVHCNEVLILTAVIIVQKVFLAGYKDAKQGNLYIVVVLAWYIRFNIRFQ